MTDDQRAKLQGVLALASAATSEERLVNQCLDMAQHWTERAQHHHRLMTGFLDLAEKAAREIT